ncbi:helix-hairpin-helix domain-containing protein [Saliphagus sp. GCM10025334]
MPAEPTILDMAFFALVLGFVAVATVRNRLSSPQTPVEEAREAYARGEIDADELERRLEFHLDSRNDQIRAFVEDVNNVGPKTSKAIAEEFDSLAELRGADRDRLESVHGVGESTAEAVLERVE